MGAPVNVWRPDGIYSVSTERRLGGGYTRIWDERRNAYLTDDAGSVLMFPLPYDAERYLKQLAEPRASVPDPHTPRPIKRLSS